MFRVDSRFEIYMPPFLQNEGAELRQFHLVEQCFNVPLWLVQVLPRVAEGEFQRWSCYLAMRAGDAFGILAGQRWERAKLHVVLPEYMTQTPSIKMSKCTALWECNVGENRQVAWQFDTALGSFIDPEFGELDISTVKTREIRWRDPDIAEEPRGTY
ncbi:hypothetical protein [Variovorax atrisoli]|uniref:hypothetical protein n=1 Tax=Variovorax atrisoli TaxID=3394203 RepID=UPI00339205A5